MSSSNAIASALSSLDTLLVAVDLAWERLVLPNASVLPLTLPYCRQR